MIGGNGVESVCQGYRDRRQHGAGVSLAVFDRMDTDLVYLCAVSMVDPLFRYCHGTHDHHVRSIIPTVCKYSTR